MKLIVSEGQKALIKKARRVYARRCHAEAENLKDPMTGNFLDCLPSPMASDIYRNTRQQGEAANYLADNLDKLATDSSAN